MKRTLAASQRTAQLSSHFVRTMATAAQEPAPWRSTFLSHVEKLSSPSFMLSTLHPVSPASSSVGYVPRARTVIFRGLWACLPVNPKNPAELNPEGIFESDLLTITTDARMEKVPEVLKTAGNQPKTQSGEGGPVEAVFWIEETNTQWRIRGHAVIVGPDIDSEAATGIRESIRYHMRSSQSPAAGVNQDQWSFSRELTAHFGNLSPGMRGSFKNPPPGTPLKEKPGPGLGLGQKVEGVDDKIARENFRVLILVPEEVDRVDLTDPSEGKRWNYKLSEGTEETRTWTVTEVWP